MVNVTDTPDAELRSMLRNYAAGTLTWSELRERGFDGYVQVLAGLREQGLRPPVAPMEGSNLAARERGRPILRRLLQEQQQK